jgi:para-aminobenzoate synthetase/4-amino-4-deoxychorismate lyase
MRIVCRNGAETLAFERPERVLRADRPGDVASVLESADLAVTAGDYVAGYLTYEAGTALVPKQKAATNASLPLIELGVYGAPRIAKLPMHADSEAASFMIGPMVPTVSRTQYEANVARILDRIREGTVYQVNLAAPFTFAFIGDPQALFEELDRFGDFEHTAYVDCGRYAIVSCSPELFVRFEGDRLITKPMKGTADGDDIATLASEKNRAEHVMIVDLLRNDLHRIACHVEVQRLADVERYPAFSTMTSTIAAKRIKRFGLAETFAAMFPCGSITGAPKVTAMQAIAELEGPRGAFCGSIGFSAPDGSGSWNVAIRTATIDREAGRGTLHVGGGIVADSNAGDEWAEILVKRRFIDRIAPRYALVETLRLDPSGIYTRLDAHIERLAHAADALHFAFDESRVRSYLKAVAPPLQSVLVRLELNCNGDAITAVRELSLETDVTLMWSDEIVDECEPLQRYKTTWRPQYEAAAEEAARHGVFDALLCNRRGDVADSTRFNVFVQHDESTLLTPRILDGALPGILRAELVATGRAREARITRNDLASASAIFVGNSARGLLRARLAEPRDDYAAAVGSEKTGSRKNGMAIG